MKAAQIPRHLLIHGATHHYGAVTNDDWGNPSWASNRQLSRVRFEPSERLVTDRVAADANTEIRLSMLMFYDFANSRPDGLTFVIGDRIVFGGRNYRVASIDILHDGRGPHHAEIGLV